MQPPDFNTVRAALDFLGIPGALIYAFERSGRLPLSVRIGVQAALDPTGVAVTDETGPTPITVNWLEFDRMTNRCANLFAQRGVTAGGTIAIALPNGLPHIVASNAAWKMGATVLPLDGRMPPQLLANAMGLVGPQAIVGDGLEMSSIGSDDLLSRAGDDSRPHLCLPDPYAILATGGSTGVPKLVVQRGPLWGRFDATPSNLAEGHGIRLNQAQLVVLPLHHGFGFGFANAFGLAYGHRLVILGKFEARITLAAIQRHGVQFCALVPTMMRRMARDSTFNVSDLSSLQAIVHGAGPCAKDVKISWLSKIGPTKVYEAYGATDLNLSCTIRGDEWLRRPGSVGKPTLQRVQVLDREGNECAPGEVGEIHVHSSAAAPIYFGGGAPRPEDRGQRRSAGDLGKLDEDGYLYVQGRVDRTINTGGVQIRPEVIEEVLFGHPSVIDVVVDSCADDDLGAVTRAMVVLDLTNEELGTSVESLLLYCSERLASNHVPKKLTIVPSIARTDMDKLVR